MPPGCWPFSPQEPPETRVGQLGCAQGCAVTEVVLSWAGWGGAVSRNSFQACFVSEPLQKLRAATRRQNRTSAVLLASLLLLPVCKRLLCDSSLTFLLCLQCLSPPLQAFRPRFTFSPPPHKEILSSSQVWKASEAEG